MPIGAEPQAGVLLGVWQLVPRKGLLTKGPHAPLLTPTPAGGGQWPKPRTQPWPQPWSQPRSQPGLQSPHANGARRLLT